MFASLRTFVYRGVLVLILNHLQFSPIHVQFVLPSLHGQPYTAPCPDCLPSARTCQPEFWLSGRADDVPAAGRPPHGLYRPSASSGDSVRAVDPGSCRGESAEL